MFDGARVAVVHDWLTGMRGGEFVLEAILELFPNADLFTLVHVPGSVSPAIECHTIKTSIVSRLPGIARTYRHFLPIYPRLAEAWDMSDYDFILSSSHCAAKGVIKRKDALHVCYLHAPMRYVWDRFDDYFGEGRGSVLTRFAARRVRKSLQDWDRRSSTPERVDLFLVNSELNARRVREYYARESTVLHPFVPIERFADFASQSLRPREERSGYLVFGALAPNKRVDLAIEAFNRLKLPLTVAGGGQEEERLRAMAGPTVRFLGSVSDQKIPELYSSHRALVFPGIEDFGMTPLEAMYFGTPVIALGEGGAVETVGDSTGILFSPQNVDALASAVLGFESGQWKGTPELCRARALEFGREQFKARLSEIITQLCNLNK